MLLAAIVMISIGLWPVPAVVAFCPSLCLCNDDTLETNCVSARLDVVPILLNPALRTLQLAHNRITTIRQSLGFYTDLEELDLSHNIISSLGQRNMESQGKLRLLNVSRNSVVELEGQAFVGLVSLQVLDLSHNQLTYLDDRSLQHLHALTDLDLSSNRIERLSDKCFASLHQLRRLRLDSNRLQFVPSPVSLLPLAALIQLDLSNNRIAQLDGSGFSSLNELRQLNMSNNTVHHIHYAAFDGLDRLLVLDLSSNRLEHVPGSSLAAIKSLRSLDLSANYMVSVGPSDFAELSHLEMLRLADVPTLRDVHDEALASLNQSLSTLIMSGNAAWTQLPTKMISSSNVLRFVDLSGNGFETVAPIQWPASLEFYDLSGNPLECNCSMHWLWQSNLQSVSTAVNSTSSVPAMPMKDISCRGPAPLAGHNFFQLDESHLHCWNAAYILLISVATGVVVTIGAALLILCCWRSKRSPSSSSRPAHVKHLTNHISSHHHQANHHLSRSGVVVVDCDSPPLKTKTLSLPKTVDYFLSDDDYVYHPAAHVKPIPVTAV